MVASMFMFAPNEIRVPAGRRIRFRMTSADVTHGFLISGTNANAMLVPGYISQFTTVFTRPGDYLIVCHEFCGNGHCHVRSNHCGGREMIGTGQVREPAESAVAASFRRLAISNVAVAIAAFGIAASC
jgi:hypothetical protein